MKTTLNLDDQLVRSAKRRALEEHTTLTHLLETALRRYLTPPPRPARPFRLNLLISDSAVIPGVDIEDRDSLYDRLDGIR